MNPDWPGAPGGWEWLKRCARRHCPHRHVKVGWDECPCPMHAYMRTTEGMAALARVDATRALFVANEWRRGDTHVSAT